MPKSINVERKYKSHKFRSLFVPEIKSHGYRSVRAFAVEHGFHYNPLSRAINGTARPSLDSLNKWCDALNCTTHRRNEIIASVYLSDEERPSQLAS